MHDTLKYRLSNVQDPAWDSVVKMITRMGPTMFMVKEDDRIVAEFMLENITGHAAQIHFSMYSDNTTPYSYKVARAVTQEMSLLPALKTLFGLTPLKNRAACLFNLRIGFKKLGVLPKSVTYFGSVEDAMLCVLSNG